MLASMKARPLLLAAAVLAAPGLARADPPCPGWVEHGDRLELQGPHGRVTLRAAPEVLAALRNTLLHRCRPEGAEGPRPPLDVGPVEVEAVLQPPPEAADGIVELQLRMRAERLLMEVR